LENLRVKRRRIVFFFAILLLASLLFIQLSYSLESTIVTLSSSGTIGTSGNSSIMPLHVSGRYIENSLGQIVTLKGFNKNGFEDYPQGSWQDASGGYSYGIFNNATVNANLQAMKADGVNLVRISSDSMYALNPTDLNYIAQLAQLAAPQGIYISYCLRQNNASGQPLVLYNDPGNGYINSPRDFVNMWGNISLTLKSYPNVIFELQNEPEDYIHTLAPIFQSCINNIRSTGATNLILIEFDAGIYYDFGPGGGNSGMSWVGAGVNFTNPNNFNGEQMNLNDSAGNLVYSTHVYLNGNFYSSANGYATDYNTTDFNYACQQLGLFAVSAKYPLIIGEIGENLNDGNTAAQLTWYKYACNLFLSNGIGVVNWWWYPSGSGTGYDTLTGGPNFALNSAGQATSTIFLSYP